MPAEPYTTDTSREAYEVQLKLLREMSPAQRIRQTLAMSGQVKRMAFDAIRRRHPDYDDEQLRMRFIELTYGKVLADAVRQWQSEQAGDGCG